eukprot:s464_g37.t1
MGRKELPAMPTIAEEREESSSYESVPEEEVAPTEPGSARDAPAAESREPPSGSGRPAALRTTRPPPEEEESSDSRAPRARRRGRSLSRSRAGRRTPFPGAFPKSRPVAVVPEPPCPAHKGRGKGKRETPKCRYCWKEVTAHESGQSQHEYWSIYCLTWQFRLAGYPYSQCEQLAEDLKQHRLARFEELGPDPNAHVAFPDEPPGTAAPALAVRHPLEAARLPPPEAARLPPPEASRLPPPEVPHVDTAALPAREAKGKKEKKHRDANKEVHKEVHKEKHKEKKKAKTSKSAAHDAEPEKKKKKKRKANKIHVVEASPSPESMRARKREPPSSSDSDDGADKKMTLISCGDGLYRLVRG